jgi:tripartite-type tricarboxylate transporter receptor subunit TctC
MGATAPARFDVDTYYRLSVPAGLAPAIRARLADEIVTAARSPDTSRRIVAAGCEPLGRSSNEFESLIGSEVAKWRRVVAQAGIRGE